MHVANECFMEVLIHALLSRKTVSTKSVGVLIRLTMTWLSGSLTEPESCLSDTCKVGLCNNKVGPCQPWVIPYLLVCIVLPA